MRPSLRVTPGLQLRRPTGAVALACAASLLGVLAVLTPTRMAAAGAGTPIYFAEGTTRPGFQEYLALANTGSTTATVDVKYEFADGSPVKEQLVVLAASSRGTIDVNQAVGAGRDVSIRVDPGSNPNIVAERPIYFNACLPVCVNGSHVAGGVQPQTSWYFAEGYTGAGFQEYLALFNPNGTSALVGITYSYPDGSTGFWSVSLPPNSRNTVDVNQFVGSGREVSARVTADSPIVAERSLYFNGCIPAFCMNGGSDAVGSSPQSDWYFADGYTGSGYHEYLIVLNPGSSSSLVGVTYLYADGSAGFWQTQVGAGARLTVDVNQFVGGAREVGAHVSGSAPVVVERALYYSTVSPFWQKGGTAGAGSTPATTWSLAEGTTGPGFQEYLAILNPGSSPASLSVRYLASDGTSSTQAFAVGAGARATIDVNAVLGGGRQFGIQVTAATPIVVERALYFQGCLGSICVNIPPPPPPPPVARKIVVSLSAQHLWAYQDGHLLLETDVATGRPELPTPAGDYHIFAKFSPFQFISPWPPGSPFYYNPAWVQYAMEFIGGGYFLHDAPWRSWYGPGANTGDGTHGCVNVPINAMTRLYGWAQIGDEVVVQP